MKMPLGTFMDNYKASSKPGHTDLLERVKHARKAKSEAGG